MSPLTTPETFCVVTFEAIFLRKTFDAICLVHRAVIDAYALDLDI